MNSQNVMSSITKEILEQCENLLAYQFHNRSLLELSLTHASLREKNGICNERLEFLGDAVLGVVISEFLYLTFQDFDEGDLSLIKSEVVSRATLARIARQIKLHLCFACGRGIQKDDQGISTAMLANVVEAVIGAMYLDNGMEGTRNFILTHFRQEIEKVIRNPYQKNYKSLLQCIAQKYLGNTPSYQMLHTEGPNHTRVFTICAVIGKRNFIAGQGSNKKEAEQAAAYAALQILALENPAIGEAIHSLLPPEKKSKERELLTTIPTLFHNSKSLLQHIVQKFHLPVPIYHKTTGSITASKKMWFISISLGGRQFSEAMAENYKDGERLAARQVLEILAEEYSPKSPCLPIWEQAPLHNVPDFQPPLWTRMDA